ncbi:D-alanyl-D-alanine carboxypeptidase-like protein [Knoellia remsis]|uniref:D-alanyl-D-alanine carboxypeptidase-like protein n=1 Tax=Knoellia remsis TaxID=407159 RepID=A0A2T0UXW3_9MICO|nr:M15 family metallopeptidase [Knoellia remsis]PRY62678.1 D-alanyl-D-alanine carboxypeptidase-like protein [Knoellia remsis]
MRLRTTVTALLTAVLAAGTAASTAASAADIPERSLPPGKGFHAVIRPVDDATRATMIGVSWKPGCPVPIEDLRIIDMTYRGFDGEDHVGQLMVHEDIARDTINAFRVLYREGFPIRRMELIENYGGDDDASMAADNTSAFNCRAITGGTRYSVHSYGKAIDINTIENPYVKGTLVLPPAGAEFLDRTDVRPGMLVDGSAEVEAFTSRGFDWGGHWTTLKDYQHMEIPRT